MKHFSRLIARGVWGETSPPGFTYDLTSAAHFKAARQAGKLGGLTRLRGLEEFDIDRRNDPEAALILSHNLIWPRSFNRKSAWTSALLQFVEEYTNPFNNGLPGLAYNSLKDVTLQSTFSFLENQPWCLRVLLLKTEKDPDETEESEIEKKCRFQKRFGALGGLWQLSCVDGSWEIARLSANWTQTKEAALNALLDKEDPTLADQQQIDELRGPLTIEAGGTRWPEAIYDVHGSLSLGSPVKHDQGSFYEITVIPEPRGKLNIGLRGAKTETIDVPQVLATRKPGKITGAGPLQIHAVNQSFIWQVGRPSFAPRNRMTVGPMKNGYFADSFGNFTMSGVFDSATGGYNPTLLGTGVDVSLQQINSVYFGFHVTATTTDNRFTPFIYAVQARLEGGTRTVNQSAVWDSNDHLDAAGNPPILDCVPACDGEMRRQSWTVTVRDTKGRVFKDVPGFEHGALENHTFDLSMGAGLLALNPVITSGLIQRAELNDLSAVSRLLSRFGITRLNSSVTLTACDAWAGLDEDLMQDVPVGDGMYLGAYIRLVLKNAGFSNAKIAGISATEGRILPKAGVGEKPCVQPEIDTPRGDWLRSLVEKWGMGLLLWVAENGIFQFADRGQSVRTVRVYTGNSMGSYQDVPLAFSSSSTRNKSNSWPGRFAVLKTLSSERDFSDFYNHFRVEGGIDSQTGERIVAEWTVQESVHDDQSPIYLGRLKRYATLRDEGLRTISDVQYVLRSLIKRFARGGRFHSFTTYFHRYLFVGDIITVDGVLCRIARLPGGSMKSDRMQIVAQEL